MCVFFFKAPLFKIKLFFLSFSALGNVLGGFGCKRGNSSALGGANGGGVVTLNQKLFDKFLKVCVEEEGARQGAPLQCPVSPLTPQEAEHSLPPVLCQWQKI